MARRSSPSRPLSAAPLTLPQSLEARLAGVSASIESGRGGRSRSLAEIAPESVEFLWRPYLPVGKLTLLEDDPGQGKSFLAAAIGDSSRLQRITPHASDDHTRTASDRSE